MKKKIIVIALLFAVAGLFMGGCQTTKRNTKQLTDEVGVTFLDADQFHKEVR